MSLRRLPVEQPLLAWGACAAIVLISVAAELARPPIADMGLFLYDAGRVLDGDRLYRDVIEVNPPLIIALNIPVVLASRITHVSEFVLYRLATALSIGALLLYCVRLLRRYVFPGAPARTRYLTVLLTFALFALPRSDFGQREHFVLALLLPYVVLAAARLEGRQPGSLECGGIGVLAGIGVALKPHFGLALLVLEGVRRWRGEPAERWRVAPEAAGALAFVAAVVLGTLRVTPEFVGVATLLAPAYVYYMRQPFLNLLFIGPVVAPVWFSIIARVGLRRQVHSPTLHTLLTAAVAGAFLAGAAQQKEFRYHFYPALALGFVLVGLLAAEAPTGPQLWTERVFSRAARALLATMVIVMLGSTALAATGKADSWEGQLKKLHELADAVRQRANGRPVGVFSYTIDSAFPMINYAGVPLAIRFPGMWPMVACYWDSLTRGGALRYHTIGEMGPAERYFFNAVRDDLLAAQPNLLVMLRPARDAAQHGQRRLHYVQYFGRDPQLAALLARYRLVDQKGEYLLYERSEGTATSTGPPPSAAPATLDAPPMRRLGDIRLRHIDLEFVFGAGIFVVCWILAVLADRRRATLMVPVPAPRHSC